MTNYKRNTKSTKISIRRPRSAYNFFYKHQRSIILHEIRLSKNKNKSERTSNDEDHSEELQSILPSPHLSVERIISLLQIDNRESRKRRRHRKTHGMITLEQLTLKIAKRWREASPETKEIYERLAKYDKLRYNEELRFNTARDNDELGPRSIEDMMMLRDGGYACLSRNDEEYFLNILLEG